MSEQIIGQADLIRALGLLRDAEMIVYKYQKQSKGDEGRCNNSDVVDMEAGIDDAAFAMSKIIGHEILRTSFYEKDK